jgi:hypothetical protein
MKIANTIYDVVFKYLLTNDTKVATLILSNLIGKKIIKLHVEPTEILATKDKKEPPIGSKESYTVMRLDFAADVEHEDGTRELILIEMQKAKLITDIMRFRKYLGAKYMSKKHTYKIDGKNYALPIFPIYFLGHKLDEFDEEAILIKRRLYNAITNEEIKKRHSNFIDGLSHDGLVIQVPRVKENIATTSHKKINKRLSELLLIFDQTKYKNDDEKHFLEIDPEDYPEWLNPIFKVLRRAATEEEVRNKMELEDDYINDLEDLERKIVERDKMIEKNLQALKKKDQALEEKNQIIEHALKTLIELGVSETEAKAKLNIINE